MLPCNLNGPHLTFIPKLTQRWCNVVIPTSEDVVDFTLWSQRFIDAFIVIFMMCCEVNLLYKVETTSAKRSKNLTPQYRHCKDVNLKSRFQRWNNVVNTSFKVNLELNLLPNVETTLEQRCNFDVVATTSLECYAFVVRRCNLTTTFPRHCVFAGQVQNLFLSSLSISPCVAFINIAKDSSSCEGLR